MTTRRDPDRLIKAFLDDGLTELPDRAYDAVRAEIDHTRQRVILGPWRRPRMSNFARFAIAAVAILAVVAVGAYVLPRMGGVVGPGATPSATAQPSAAEPTSSASSSQPGESPVAGQAGLVSNGWIAYSTLPWDNQLGQEGETWVGSGGDIFLVREGVEPILVAGRGDGSIRNVCPAFSPDGGMLAFGEAIDKDRAVVVVTVAADGSISETARIPVTRYRDLGAPCPLWSMDGMRVAYLDGVTVHVRGLDGSARAVTTGDPEVGDFVDDDQEGPLLSPAGDWVVQEAPPDFCRLAVARPDGSNSRIADTRGAPCFYSIAAWSPDGLRVLLMEDVSGFHFTMHAASIDPTEAMVTIVSRVGVNGSRSWPRRGDVSWQPVFP